MKREEMVILMAKAMYEADCDRFMPPWDEAPSVYTRGCINKAHVALLAAENSGMLPPKYAVDCFGAPLVSEWEQE